MSITRITAELIEPGSITGDILATGSIPNHILSSGSIGSHNLHAEFNTTHSLVGTEVDFKVAQVFNKTLSSNTTLTFKNFKVGMVKDLLITGNYALSLPTEVKVKSGEYDGTVVNLIEIACTDDTTPSGSFWGSISQQIV